MKYYFMKLYISLVRVVKLCNFFLTLTSVLQVVNDHV